MKGKEKKQTASVEMSSIKSLSASHAFFITLACGLFLVVGFWVSHDIYAVNLVTDPSLTLSLIWAIEFAAVVLVYSFFRENPEKCSYLKAIARSIPGLLIGALVNAFGAIVLGAPLGLQYLPKTISWSLLMSVLTFVPASTVYGASWVDWRRIFAFAKPYRGIEYMLCLPAHGAIIGAWFGAWPMPLDWERPWQEWPICVTYGAIAGYIAGLVGSFGLILTRDKQKTVKAE